MFLYSYALVPSHLSPTSLCANTYVHKMFLYNCRETFTDVMSALQIRLFMQNKAKFRKVKLNVNKVLTKDYVQMDTWSIRKKQSQTNPNKAKLKKAKMNVTSYITVDYENIPPIRAQKKQSQTSKRQKPMQTSLAKRIMKKTALLASGKTNPNKPNQTQFQRDAYSKNRKQSILPLRKDTAAEESDRHSSICSQLFYETIPKPFGLEAATHRSTVQPFHHVPFVATFPGSVYISFNWSGGCLTYKCEFNALKTANRKSEQIYW